MYYVQAQLIYDYPKPSGNTSNHTIDSMPSNTTAFKKNHIEKRTETAYFTVNEFLTKYT